MNNFNLGLSFNSLPKGDEKLEQKGIITILNFQKGLKIKTNKEKNGKGTYGSIFPYLNDTIKKGGNEEPFKTDGVLFVDLDHLKNDKADEIFNNFEKIFGKNIISCFFSASHNLHFLAYSDKIGNRENYVKEGIKAYASICSDLLKYYNTDYDGLLNIIWNGEGDKYKDVFDFHSLEPTQRLFLFPSDYKLNHEVESVEVEESIYDTFGWKDKVQEKLYKAQNTYGKGQVKTSEARVQAKTSGARVIIQNQNGEKEYLYKWRDYNNFPIIKRVDGTYDFLNEVYDTANDFRFRFLATLTKIEGVDLSLVQNILPDEWDYNALVGAWNYGVSNGYTTSKFLRYLYDNGFIESKENVLYNYELELSEQDPDWRIIEDGKYLTDYKDEILKEIDENQTVFIESGCGTGKTTLITKILEEGRKEGKNILGFCHLNSILSQSYKDFGFKINDDDDSKQPTLQDLFLTDKSSYIGLGCYFANFNYIENKNFIKNFERVLMNIKNSGGYIIIDEIHSLHLGASYRGDIMNEFLVFLYKAAKMLEIKIMAFTGTPLTYFPDLFNKTLKFCRKNVEEKDRYEIKIIEGGKGDYLDEVDYVLKHQNDDSKFIIFNNFKRKKIGEVFRNNMIFNFDDICRDKRNYKDLSLRDNSTNILLNTGFLPQDKDVFVATEFIKEGVNIEDVADKIIFLTDISNIKDVISLIQLGGRARKQKSVIYLFVKNLEDFNTSQNEFYYTTRYDEPKGKLYGEYLRFVDNFKNLGDWVNYIKDHRLPVVINKINYLELRQEEKDNNKTLNLKNMNKIKETVLKDPNKILFKASSIGALESINPDYLNDGFYIEPVDNKYFENRIYFKTKKVGVAVLRLLRICDDSKILEESEISQEKLQLLANDLYFLAKDIYKWVKENSRDFNFLYKLTLPYKPELKEDLEKQFYGAEEYKKSLLNYAGIKVRDLESDDEIDEADLIDEILETHTYFKLFEKYQKTLAILLDSFYKEDLKNLGFYVSGLKENWEEIEDIFLAEFNYNKKLISDKRAKAKMKQEIFVIGGKEKVYNSRGEVDKDYKALGFNYIGWKKNKSTVYNLKENEVWENIKKVDGKFIIM